MIARTADRALQIFEVFAERLTPLTLSEMARTLEMPVSSCSKLLHTLQARGYLYEVGGRKAYYPTARWLVKATAIAAADPVAELVQPYLEKLRNDTGETALLGKRMGDMLIHLCVVNSTQSIRYNGQVGDLKDFHSTASGKAILASLPLPQRQEVVTRIKLPRGTPVTITKRKELLAAVQNGLQRGWWATRGENSPDVMAMAAPILIGAETFTIAIAGPVTRMEPRLDNLAKSLLSVCRKIVQSS